MNGWDIFSFLFVNHHPSSSSSCFNFIHKTKQNKTQESMLESVIVARDRFLKPGGKILPAEAKVYIAPFTNDFFVVRSMFWKNVFGFDFSPIM